MIFSSVCLIIVIVEVLGWEDVGLSRCHIAEVLLCVCMCKFVKWLSWQVEYPMKVEAYVLKVNLDKYVFFKILSNLLGRLKVALYCFYFHRKCPERPE